MKILFLDLDGTLRKTKSGEKFITHPYDQQAIEGAKEACSYYKEQGWTLIGITNQGGVKWGYKSLDNMVLEQQETLRIFPELLIVHACPDDGFEMVTIYKSHYSLINCEDLEIDIDGYFRKPNIGMVEYFVKTHHDEISQSIFVGDREEDQLCALNANIPFMWAHEWLILSAYHQGLITECGAAKSLGLDLLSFRERFGSHLIL